MGPSLKLVKMMAMRIQVTRGTLSMLMTLAILHVLLKIIIDQPIYWRMKSIKLVKMMSLKMKAMRGTLSMLMKPAILHVLMKMLIDQSIY